MKKTVLLMAGILTVVGMTAAEAKGRHGGADREVTFAQLDANGDGQITQAEFEAHRAAKFAEADSNGDGALSVDELVASVDEDRQERAKKRLEKRIARLDTNKDGMLQAEEMANTERQEKMIERLDTNNDGQISEEEFDAAKKTRGGKKPGKKGDKATTSE